MCCTLHPAVLSNTVLYAGEAEREGRLVHVLGYQNKAANLADGPNAMILPFPSSKFMGPKNCLESEGLRWLMNDLAASITPHRFARSKSSTVGAVYGSSRVLTFDSGIYTVVLAEDARDIPSALHKVPEEKRPDINDKIFDAYARFYQGWPIALCCFNAKKQVEQDPLIWWYEPADRDVLFAPALDAHDGRPPVLDRQVKVDHTVVFGSALHPKGVTVRPRREIPDHVKPFIATRVVGYKYTNNMMLNGDFSIPKSRLELLPDNIWEASIQVDRVKPMMVSE